MIGFLRYYLGQWQREKAAEARADMEAYEAWTVPHGLLALEVAMREAIAESLDGIERYRRVKRLATSYPITWETAERYDKKLVSAHFTVYGDTHNDGLLMTNTAGENPPNIEQAVGRLSNRINEARKR